MAKTDLKASVIKTYNTTNKVVKKVKEVNTKIIYGNARVPAIINFSDPVERRNFTSNIKSFRQDPSLVNAVFILQNLNSFDLCNPLMFAVSQAFPPGSGVANVFGGVQSKLNDITSAFESFSLVDGEKQAKATVVNSTGNTIPTSETFGTVRIPFATGVVSLNIQTQDKINPGANITLTQTEDERISSKMTGRVATVVASDNFSIVSINIDNIYPPDAPTTENGESKLTFSNFNVEYESKTSTDIRELANDLESITRTLQNIGLPDIANELDNLPDFIPGVGKIKKALNDVTDIIDLVSTQTAAAATVTGTASNALAGNLTASEVLSRVRVLRDFYAKIRPYTNLNFAIESFLGDEIDNINRFLRDAIPYEALAAIVGFITTLGKMILGVINFIIGILKIISSTIKVITTILKVIKVVVKVLKKLFKGIPSIGTTVGVQEASTNAVGGIEDAIQQILDLLEIIQWGVDDVIAQLGLTRFYLLEFISEGAKLQGTLESCPQLNDSGFSEALAQANRNAFTALQNLLSTVPQLNVGYRSETGRDALNRGVTTFVIGEGGVLIPLRDSVYGFDEFGNLIFYGDLVSLSTGVNFEDTLGTEFRSKLKYYTFNKFKNSQRPLLEAADNLFIENARIADPDDVFGNFQELYLGYTLKIQEEKPIGSTDLSTIRRRAIALDSNEKIVASTDLTFSTDLSGLVQEIKFLLQTFVNQGTIGINTFDSDPNEISNDDAANLAASLGTNPFGLSNLAATNNKNSLQSPSGIRADESNIEARIGNEPYTSPNTNLTPSTVQGVPQTTSNTNTPAQTSTGKSNTAAKNIDVAGIAKQGINDFINESPSLKRVQDTFSILSKTSPKQLSQILSAPGAENLNEEELIASLKVSILDDLDPNPEQVEKVKELTDKFLEALENVIRLQYQTEYATVNPKNRPPFELYYDRVEKDKIQIFYQSLLKKGFTENEVQLGTSQDEIKQKYKVVVDGTKVTVTRTKKFGK